MASKTCLLLALSLFLTTTCLARQQHQQQQQQNQCQLQNIEALEPIDVIKAEAGFTEIWDNNNQQFQCAGVDFVRHRIQPGGLFLPSYVSTPVLSFVEKGRGIHGVILPGCPETYEYSPEQQFDRRERQQQSQEQQFDHRERQQQSPEQQFDRRERQQQSQAQQFDRRGRQQSQEQQFDRRGRQQSQEQQFDRRGRQQSQEQQFDQFQDRHQKVENVNQGDVVAIPAGAAHWLHNNGDNELVVVVFFDTQNNDNQLDENYRRFFLAGNPQSQSQERRQKHQHPYQNNRNIFNGFAAELLAQVFNVDREIAEKLQGQNDQRGHIVDVGQELQTIRPRQQSEFYQRGSNGLEETICSLKLKENIDNPSHADFVNPQAGRIANLNSFKFSVLKQLQLSVERGELYSNAIRSPHWTVNAHNLLYVTDGSLRMQIVNNEGNSVFDDELREGQAVVIPQNFAVIKRGGEQGGRWVSFRTNDNAFIANLAGRVSAIRSLPVDVVANSYQLSKEQAHRLKFSQRETVLFSPQGQETRRASA